MVDQDLQCRMESLGRNELTNQLITSAAANKLVINYSFRYEVANTILPVQLS